MDRLGRMTAQEFENGFRRAQRFLASFEMDYTKGEWASLTEAHRIDLAKHTQRLRDKEAAIIKLRRAVLRLKRELLRPFEPVIVPIVEFLARILPRL